MLTSGLKMLPAANPGARSLPAGNERRGVSKQGAIGEDPDPVGLGLHLSKRGSRDELPVPTAALGPQAAELWQGPLPTPVGICPWPVSPHALRPPSPISSPRAAAGSLREAARQRKCVGGEDPLFHTQHQGGLCSWPHPLTLSSPQPDWGPKPGSCGQGAREPPPGSVRPSQGRSESVQGARSSCFPRGQECKRQAALSAVGLRHAPPAQCPLECCEAWSAQHAGSGQHGRHPPRHRGRHVPCRELVLRPRAEQGPPPRCHSSAATLCSRQGPPEGQVPSPGGAPSALPGQLLSLLQSTAGPRR